MHALALVLAASAALPFPSAAPPTSAGRLAAQAVEHRTELPTGVSMRWLEAGDPAGEAVLLLHGFTDSSLTFEGTLEELARLRPDLHLLVPDLRGHGGTSLPAGEPCRSAPERCLAVPQLAADALALLDARGIERAHVVGHSLGSLVAQELALSHPERVLRIALLGASPRIAGNPAAAEMLGVVEGAWGEALRAAGHDFPADAHALTTRDVGPLALDWLAESWVVEPAADPEVVARILARAEGLPLATWLGVLRSLQDHDLTARLADLRAPVLVVWATHDVIFPEDPDQALLRDALGAAARKHGTPAFWKAYGLVPPPASGVPGQELGHNFPWAAPHALARDLAAFLRPDGAPTTDLPHAAAQDAPAGPGEVQRVVVTPGAARVVRCGAKAPAR